MAEIHEERGRTLKGKRLALFLGLAAAVVMTTAAAVHALAKPEYMNQIPSGYSKSCSLCHSNVPALNDFGQKWAAAGKTFKVGETASAAAKGVGQAGAEVTLVGPGGSLVTKAIQADGDVLVPIRSAASVLDLAVAWNQQDKTVVVSSNSVTMRLKPGSAAALVNDKQVTLPLAPRLDSGRVLVPAKFLAGNFRFGVSTGQGRVVFNKGIPPGELDPSVWGKAFPLHYRSYLKNKAMSNEGTRYGGSVPRDHLAEYPEMLTLFAGYGFSKEYNEDRGHVYSLEDVLKIKRVTPKTTGSCLTCKSANVPVLIKEKGLAYYTTPFQEIAKEAKHPIACANCHDDQTMELKITQPPLRNALQRLGKNPDALTRQELRSLVCAQCHVEYYFKPGSMEVTFPWDKGFSPEQILQYYDEQAFQDWTHPQAGTPLLKVQHPEFENFQGSTHQSMGVTCADCHMPKVNEGGRVITSHWWTSPLKTAKESCTGCHPQGENWVRERVLYTQDRTYQLLRSAGEANVAAIKAIEEAAKTPGVDEALLKEARNLHRQAQWYWDWVSAENSMGFHNPQQSLATLAKALDLARQAELKALKAKGAGQ